MSEHRDSYQLLLDLRRRRSRTEEEMEKAKEVEVQLHKQDAVRAMRLLDRINKQIEKKAASQLVVTISTVPTRVR